MMTRDAQNVEVFRRDLLAWYDRHRRVLPWRALPGRTADPYHVWLSEIMLQQTTVQAVIPYFQKFLETWPTVRDLADASEDSVMQAWAGLGYYARARNLHKCAKFIADENGGVFPDDIDGLRSLPGVGDYTSAAVAAIAFNRPANVVDGNVERVMSRVFAVEEPLPAVKPRLKLLAASMAGGEDLRPGDYAQALMDLGATVCTPTSPKCILCPVDSHCEARRKGIATELPRRLEKPAKPRRHGFIYFITDLRGRIVFERRPEKGLLGRTIGLPTSDWTGMDAPQTHLPFVREPQPTSVSVRHVFTHFELVLTGVRLCWTADGLPPGGVYFWATLDEARGLGMPTLFKKAFRLFV